MHNTLQLQFVCFFPNWQADTFRGFDSNETNPTDAGNVITSRPRDKLILIFHYKSAFSNQTWQDGNLP